MTTQKTGIRGCICFAAAGLAAAAVAGALLAQQRRARETYLLEQQHHTDLARQQRLQWELLSKAIEDPSLAAILDTYGGAVPPSKHRQFLFANALYSNALLAYRIQVVTWEELHGYLRITCQNPIFREYWEATRPHRSSLAGSSDEARVGRMMDSLIEDLEEADTDEWWVIGEPPEEAP
ncbi:MULTISPECIES: DUF6082 family protein [unclassified Streptomyces]|uniref:DUF6082 family protein n=1 Tax=unclassified Streptomyces TaxID=2593676 RepID=UPI00341D8730